MINKHKIILIVAVDNNWAIGKDNDLLYSVPADMKFFREKTTDNIIVYGYKTLMSFPNQKPLPKRTNIVLTSKTLKTENLFLAHSIDDVIDIISNIKNEKDVFICGGASIYRQMLDLCDEAYVTKIDAETKDATAFMINLDNHEKWRIIEESDTITDEKSQKKIKFCTYRRDN